MTQEHVFDLIPGYALGSLDDDELIQVARHLPGCPACQAELAAYTRAADQLAMMAPRHTPPAGLRARVVQRVEREAAGHAASQPAPAHPPRPAQGSFGETLRSLLGRRSAWVLSGVALLAVLFLGISNLLLWRQVNTLQARQTGGSGRIVQLQGTDNAPQATGYLVLFPRETYGTLVVNNAPSLAPGHQYQIWLIQDGQRTSGGVFSVSEEGYGTLMIDAKQPLDTYQSFGVTVEPTGGSPGPTGPKVLGGGL